MGALRKAVIVAALASAWSCSGDEPKEPVQHDSGPVTLPDVPGDPGETADKPAGEGQANGVPEADAAQAAGKPSGKDAKAAATGGAMVIGGGASSVNVRGGPGMAHGVVKVLKAGERVAVVECTRGWCKLGEGLFVAKKFLEAPPK